MDWLHDVVSEWGLTLSHFIMSAFWYECWSWKRKWQPTPVFLPGEFHGQRRLGGYIPWGRKESGTTEVT